MAEVVEWDRWDELSRLRLVWTSLAAQTPGATFYQTYDWFVAFGDAPLAPARPRVLEVRAAGRTIGLAPLVEVERRSPLGVVRVLTYPLPGPAAAGGPIGPSPAATLALAMRHVARTPRRWDVLEPLGVDAAGDDRGRTVRAMRWAGLRPIARVCGEASVVDLGEFRGFDGYLASRTSEFRSAFVRDVGRLELRHELRFERSRTAAARCGGGDPRADLLAKIAMVDRCAGLGPSAVIGAGHAAASQAGAADLAVLEIDGYPAAYHYGFLADGVLSGVRTACDPAAPVGSATALLTRLIADGFRRGDTRIEIGEGAGDISASVRTSRVVRWRYTQAAPRSLRGHAIAAGMTHDGLGGSRRPTHERDAA